MKPKHALILAAIWVMFTLVNYLIIAACLWQWNPFAWDEVFRLILAMGITMTTVVYAFLVFTIKLN